jgi:hypothetical protein
MAPARSSKSTRAHVEMVAAAPSRPDSSRTALGAGRAPKKRKFYIVTHSTVSRASGFELLNERTLLPFLEPPPGRRGFRDYPEAPVFLCDARVGRTNRDFEEYCGYWFISDRMKEVLERFDSAAFAFLKCKVQLPDGTEGSLRWLCDVVHVLDALDEEKSRIAISTASDGSKFYSFFGGENLVFKEDAVGPHHIFRMKYRESKVICDGEMRSVCKAAELVGISFVDFT